MFFKQKISKEEFIVLIYQLGFERYKFLKTQLEGNLEYKDSLLFILTETLSSMLVKRIYYFQNHDLGFDIVYSVDKIVDEAFQKEEDKWNHTQYFIYLIDELWDILKNDNSNTINILADYYINEITDGKCSDAILKQYIIQLICNWYFETKKILKSIKIISN